MTVTLKIAPEREAVRRGMSLEEWLLQVAEDATAGTEVPAPQFDDPGAWIQRFHEFVERYGVNNANLPDEALTRESIYDDRGA